MPVEQPHRHPAKVDRLGKQGSLELLVKPLEIPTPPPGFRPPFIIGVAGGSASGKKEVCNYIVEKLRHNHRSLTRKVAIISLTSFYRELNEQEREQAKAGQSNLDHPDAFDWPLLEQVLQNLLSGRVALIPKFDYKQKIRLPEPSQVIDSKPDVVLIEGILILYSKRIRENLCMRLFVDVDADVRLSNTVLRDTTGKGERETHSLEFVLNQWVTFVKPSFEDFILPSKKTADVIIPRGIHNEIALNLIVQLVEEILLSGDVGNINRKRVISSSNMTPSSPTTPTSNLPSSPVFSTSVSNRRASVELRALTLNTGESIYQPVLN